MSKRSEPRESSIGKEVTTTLLNFTYDTEELDRRYEIFKITCDPEYTDGKDKFPLLTDPECDEDGTMRNAPICSILYAYNKAVYMLLERCPGNGEMVRSYVKNKGDLLIDTLSPAELVKYDGERTLANLLLNGSRRAPPECRYNNLNGHLWLTNKSWIGKRVMVLGASVKCVPKSDELYMSLEAKTLTQLKWFKGDDYKKKVNKPMFAFRDDSIDLRRVFSNRDKTNLVEGRPKGRNNANIPYLDLSNRDKYRICKARLYVRILDDFNELYEGCAALHPKHLSITAEIDPSDKDLEAFEKQIVSAVGDMGVRIIAVDRDEEELDLAWKISEQLRVSFRLDAEIGDEPVEGMFNIRVIHDSAYYHDNSLPDPHRWFRDMAVQHLTVEQFGTGDDSLLAGVLLNVLTKELLFKLGLVEGRDTTGRWATYGYEEDVVFVEWVTLDSERMRPKTYCPLALTLHPDGTMEFGELDDRDPRYDRICSLWPDPEKPSEYDHVVIFGGSVVAIAKTGAIPVPEISAVDEAFRNKRGRGQGRDGLGPKGRKTKDRALYGILDLKLMEYKEEKFYLCGYKGSNIPKGQNKAPAIRIIKRIDGDDISEKLIEWMNVPYVRYGQLTVLPYPFKYLKEYIESISR